MFSQYELFSMFITQTKNMHFSSVLTNARANRFFIYVFLSLSLFSRLIPLKSHYLSVRCDHFSFSRTMFSVYVYFVFFSFVKYRCCGLLIRRNSFLKRKKSEILRTIFNIAASRIRNYVTWNMSNVTKSVLFFLFCQRTKQKSIP